MRSIHSKENLVFDEIIDMLESKERELFVSDGLCWADICCGENIPHDKYIEMEDMYLHQRPRIVFLCKEPNKNAGEDYRDWHWHENKRRFASSIAFWLEGLLSTTSSYYPVKRELRKDRKIFTEHPFVIINVKKTAGGNQSDWNGIFNDAKRHAEQLRKQISFYVPNIIVCCGSTDDESKDERMLTVAKKYLYPDYEFSKINNFCHYNNGNDLLLIDSYHPSYGTSDEWKFDKMFECYHDFLQNHPHCWSK